MDIDFNQRITNPFGRPVIQDDGTPLLLGHACVNALSNGVQGDKRTATEKIASCKLADRIVNAGGIPEQEGVPMFKTIKLTAAEITLISGLVEKYYTAPFVYARVVAMLEPDAEK